MTLRDQLQDNLGSAYTLERELGGGGMSHVFVAMESRLGRRVVVKVLSTEIAAGISVERFEREIRVAASLQQVNIVQVLSAGDMNGLPYYTMPYVEGESLRARIRERGSLSIGEVVSVLRDVARALAYAHERGIVHRDIKPDNVLLSGGAAVVTDFGIAKALSAARSGPESATLTQLGTAIGTPAYISPEQAAGDPTVDHRADIYSYGCTAYELLTGQPPFANRTPQRLMAAHMTETPRPVQELRPDTPPALAALVMRCLEKDATARPQSATEILGTLDTVATSDPGRPAMPPVLLGGPLMFWKALGVYAAACIAVAVLAQAAIVGIGLPGWVLPGALISMALGLPVILFTAYTQRVMRRAVTQSPMFTPGGTPSLHTHGTMAALAIKASPHVSWRRTMLGGVWAVIAFVALVGGFMLLRTLGVGPAGSLFAAGKLAPNDKVIVATFDAPGADSSLGSTLAEALRTNLSQSRVVHVVSASAIAAALEQMQRSDTTRIDLGVAREIAQRTGAKAVVGGRIVPAGTGYIVTARLVVAESGDELASYSESAKDAGGLIPAVDRLTKELRGRIGESLKSVRATPPLEQVTTASLGALKSYAAGLQANDMRGDYNAAIQDFRDAIAQDSTFAMAYVQLAYSLRTLFRPSLEHEIVAALTTGFRMRDRLPERERYNVEGAYYYVVAHDRRKVITALRHAIALDSTSDDPENTLAVTLDNTRDYAAADSMYHLAISNDPSNGTMLANLASHYTEMGRHASFDSVMALMASRHVPFPTGRTRFWEMWNRRDYDGAERIVRAEPDTDFEAQGVLADIAEVHGRLREFSQRYTQSNVAGARLTGDTSGYLAAYREAIADADIRGDAPRAVATLDAAVRHTPVATFPASKSADLFWLVAGYARAGAPAKARDVMTRYLAPMDTLALRRNAVDIVRLRGLIALAEGKTDSATADFHLGDNEVDGLPTGRCRLCTPLYLGLSFDRAGRPDSARAYLTRYVNQFDVGRLDLDATYLAPVLFRLGELYEAAADTAHATEYYGRFVDLWAQADPELQPRVSEARARIAQLERGKR
jgi:tetratricopeptide (TPR) repeat protein/TolB-like protein